MEEKKIIKSKHRVTHHWEVFTSDREISNMLDLVKNEAENIGSRFLEPACGDGNFLAAILRRKLEVVTFRYRKSQTDWERYAIIALSSIYGVELLQDNVEWCRERLYQIFLSEYSLLYKKKVLQDCLDSAKYILSRNILWWDALDFTNPISKESIVFSEWTPVNGSLIKRRDYAFKFLVEKSHQFSLFDESWDPAEVDQPVKDYPLSHFLKLSTAYEASNI